MVSERRRHLFGILVFTFLLSRREIFSQTLLLTGREGWGWKGLEVRKKSRRGKEGVHCGREMEGTEESGRRNKRSGGRARDNARFLKLFENVNLK